MGLEISEGQTYPVPEERFLSRHLNELYDLLAHLLESGEGVEAAREHLAMLGAALADFRERAVPALLESLMHEEQARPGHEFPGQVRYLVRTGVDLFERGLAELAATLDPVAPEQVEPAFETLQQGNDHLCLSFILVEQRRSELEKFTNSEGR